MLLHHSSGGVWWLGSFDQLVGAVVLVPQRSCFLLVAYTPSRKGSIWNQNRFYHVLHIVYGMYIFVVYNLVALSEFCALWSDINLHTVCT